MDHVSDGSQLLSLVDLALAGRHRSTINYALTSIELYRWHTREVHRLVGFGRKEAAEQVTTGLLRSRKGNDATPSREERKGVYTHLARGKKWERLAGELGFGILLMRAWYACPDPLGDTKRLIYEGIWPSPRSRRLRLYWTICDSPTTRYLFLNFYESRWILSWKPERRTLTTSGMALRLGV